LRRNRGAAAFRRNKPTNSGAAVKSPWRGPLVSSGHENIHPFGATSLKTSTVQRLAIAGALSLGLAASAACAQDRPARPGAPHAQGPRGPDGHQRFTEMKQRREQRLHDLLQIRPDQDAAFRVFLAAVEQARPQRGREAGPRRGPGPQARLSAPERLDRLTQRAAERQQRLQKTTAAVKTFYAVLSAEQRKAFDELPLIRIGDRHGGHRGGRFQGRPSIG
jgi:Spy/CpxP family protein refolding chaperone